MKKIFIILIAVAGFTSCTKSVQQSKTEEKVLVVPGFSSDSAYAYIQQQVDFGARVPNTVAHDRCAAYLSAKLRSFGAEVVEQKADLKAFDGTVLKSVNLIGSYNTKAENRVVLFSHWDSRPWADNDPDPKNHKKPVMAANDGASGVGVLLEMARLIEKNKPAIGVDIVFLDSEDYGQSEAVGGQANEDSWCLGTQYWAANPHVQGYRARYGILLDMVGGKQATFYREQASEYYAASVVNTVWSQAKSLGFGQYFVDDKGGAITDDHIYVNKIIGIPCIDIIQYDPNTGGFASYWHTVDDTMKNVDKTTLFAVGTTLMHVVYNEK
jgi:Zn-dependent M28 family amino/carboxypeptidase